MKWDEKREDARNTNGLTQALTEQLGLCLEPATRPVGMVRVGQDKDGKQARR